MSVADALIFLTTWIHVILAPYTKVEESFNLHATHDVLMYGLGKQNLFNYDHLVFPGAVPRTFIGSVLLAWTSYPVASVGQALGLIYRKSDLQVTVRLVLATFNALCLCRVRRQTSLRFGERPGLYFALLTSSQFHLPFWMGRPIPNMFALIPTNYGLSLLLARTSVSARTQNIKLALSLFTFAAVVFRAELVLLIAPLCLQLLLTKRLSFIQILTTGVVASLVSLACTVSLDSYVWNRFPLWPEFASIVFNVVEGKSSEWGVSPPLMYFTSYLPKLLLGSLPLSLVGLVTDPRIRKLLIAPLTFIALISFLAHKEWRFIIYVVPFFNVAAATGASWLASRKRAYLGRFCFLITLGIITLNLVYTTISTLASMSNYPGGDALRRFHEILPPTTYPLPHVHISNLAAQSGASLFLHLHSPPYLPSTPISTNPSTPWIYNKTEHLNLSALGPSWSPSSPITHLISEVSPVHDSYLHEHWRVVEAIPSFDRVSIDWLMIKGVGRGKVVVPFWRVLKLQQKDSLWILERRSNS